MNLLGQHDFLTVVEDSWEVAHIFDVGVGHKQRVLGLGVAGSRANWRLVLDRAIMLGDVLADFPQRVIRRDRKAERRLATQPRTTDALLAKVLGDTKALRNLQRQYSIRREVDDFVTNLILTLAHDQLPAQNVRDLQRIGVGMRQDLLD
ncbi:MAG: hypothetical protein HC828_12855 [Blastochloris sp.]|nr:hypothetical protein [Blastochloris sp.]